MSDWYYLSGSEQNGPVAESDLQHFFATGQLPAETLVWRDGMENWAAAGQVPGLIPPPALPPLPVVTPKPVAVPPAVTTTAQPAPAGKICAACKAAPAQPNFPIPLCEPCRTKLIKFPVPTWLRIAAAALVVLMLVSSVRIPWELSAAANFERGRQAEDRGDYTTAVVDYQNALASYPNSIAILGPLARAAHRAGNDDLAVKSATQIVKLSGPNGQVDNDTAAIVNEILGTK